MEKIKRHRKGDFFIPKDADLLRNRKVNTKKRQNRNLPELAFLILGTYFTAPFFIKKLCVKPIFTIGIKHKKIVSILYKIMKE